MRIQFASDLHLELRPKSTFRELLDPVAPVLALLGDIAPLDNPNLRPFMEWCSQNWDTVLWIPGKLELGVQARRIPAIDEAVRRMQKIVEPYWNITVLDHEGMVSEDGVYIFGLPFWKFPRDEGYVWHPEKYMYVPAEPSPIDAKYMAGLYNADLAWIRAKVRSVNEPILILSHYGPTTWLQEEGFIGDPDRSVIFPDVEQILKTPVVGWLCGNCHQSVQTVKEWSEITGSKGSLFLATNPKGRPFENLEYRRDAVVRVDPSLFRS
jgi:hypothetical protein